MDGESAAATPEVVGPQQRLHDDPARAVRVADVVKALSHPLRLRIISLLCEGETYVGALAQRLDCSQTLVSQQLRVLRMNQLVAVLRSDGRAYYRVAEPRLRDFIRCMDGL